MSTRFAQRLVSFISLTSILFQSLLPFASLTPQAVFAQDPIKNTIIYSSTTPSFHFEINNKDAAVTTGNISYSLLYKNDTSGQIENANGSTTLGDNNFSRDIDAATCSSGVCVKHVVSRGIVKVSIDSNNWFDSQWFAIENGSLVLKSEFSSGSVNDLSNDETQWLNNGTLVVSSVVAPTVAPTVEPTATPSPTLVPPTPTAEITSAPTPTATTTPSITVVPTVASTTSPDETVNTEIVKLDGSYADPSLVPATYTDKLDYAPTEKVVVSGKNFTPFVTYTITISSSDYPPVTAVGTFTALGDGTFTYEYQLDGNYRPNYSVEIKNSANTTVATATFTDSLHPQTVAVIGSQTPNPVLPGNSATYGSAANNSVEVTYNGAGSCTVALSVISGLPTGATAVFSPTSVTSTTGSNQFSLLTINTSASTPTGTVTLTIQAHGTSGCTGPSDTITDTTNLVVGKTTPTITFDAAPTPTYLGGNFTVSASTSNTDSSSLTYSKVSGPCNFVSGTTFSSTGAGTCVVQADGAETAHFNAASNTQNVTISQATQTINITTHAPANAAYGTNFIVAATGGASGNSIIYSSGSPSVCTNSGATFTMISGTGTCSVLYNQAGNTNYSAASQVTESTSTTKITPTITWNNPADISYATALSATQLNASTSVAGTFTYNPLAGTVLSVGNGQTLSVDFVPTDTADYNNASANVTINVLDSTAPVIAITSPVAGGYVKGSDIITFTDDDFNSPQCSIDNTHFVSCSSGAITFSSITGFGGLSDGSLTLYVKDTDSANNTGSASVTINKDTTAPTTTDDADGNWHNGSVTVHLDCEDSGSDCDVIYFTTDGSTPTASHHDGTGSSVFLTLDGQYTIKYYSVDHKGNAEEVREAAHVVKIDTTAPTTPTANPPAGDYTSDQVVTLGSTDAGSGVAAIYYTTDGTTPDNTSTLYPVGGITVDKDMTIQAIAYDNLGYASGVLSATYGVSPHISDETSTLITTNSTTVTWTTDDSATSRVVYDTVSHPTVGVGPNYGYALSTVETDSAPKVTSHSVAISGLSQNTTYYYRVISHGSPEAVGDEQTFATTQVASSNNTSSNSGGGNGGGGSVLGAATAPVCNDQKPGSAPSGLVAVAGLNSVTLTWNKAQDPVSYYLVTYGTSSGSQAYGNPNVGGSSTTSYTITNLSGGTTYYFRVRAGNGCAPGDYSNEASVTPNGGVVTGTAPGFSAGVLGVSTGSAQLTGTPSPTGSVQGTTTSNSKKAPWWPWILLLLLPPVWLGYKKWKNRKGNFPQV